MGRNGESVKFVLSIGFKTISNLPCVVSQIRLLFNRKNKTLRAVLMTKSVLKMLEDNKKTVMALHSDSDVIMDERPVQDCIEEILQKEMWKDKRAAKLDLDDFLELLSEFNEAGIHFS